MDGDDVKADAWVAHVQAHRRIKELEAELAEIRHYAENEHPLLSSRHCPLCKWSATVEDGFWKGQFMGPCGYHAELHRLYSRETTRNGDLER